MPTQNLDDILLNQITGTQPPVKPVVPDVPRETLEEPVTLTVAPKVEPLVAKVEAKVDQVASEKPVESNEYGDATKPAPELEKSRPNQDADEYGLEAEQQKTFSKSEMDAYANKLIRERLARLERNSQSQQPPQVPQTQPQKDFAYDENSNLDWQQQLKQFVRQTNIEQQQEQHRQIQQAQEQHRMQEFEGKFRAGMEKYSDYADVVGGKNITDAMVLGARGINDPASFFYAAAKRAPEELAKIANEADPYAQAAAIGRLDAMLRKQATKTSSAPKPVSQTKADSTIMPAKPKTNHNELDQMLIADQQKRLSLIQSRRGR